MSALDVFGEKTRAWFEGAFAEPTPAQTLGWPAIAKGGNVLIQAPTGSGKTLAAFLYGIDRLDANPGEGLRLLYVSPLKALNYDVERNLRGPLAGLRSELRVAVRTGRHAAERAPADGAQAAGHPDHDSRVAVPDPHVSGPRDAADGRDADPRRGARGRRDEARRPSRNHRGAARRAPAVTCAAHRPVGNAAAAGGDRPLRLRWPVDRARRRRACEGARPRGRRPRGGHARAAVQHLPLVSGARRRAGDGRGHRARRPLHLAVDLPGDPAAGRAAPLDDRLRQQPPPGRAARAAAERAGGARAGASAPRLARARTARSRWRSS